MATYRVLLTVMRGDDGEDNTATLTAYDIPEAVHRVLDETLRSVTDSVSTMLITDIDEAVRHAENYDGGIFL